MGRDTRNPDFDMDNCSKSQHPDGRHHVVREVKQAKTPGKQQDRLVCEWCGDVLYGWGGAFKPNPQAQH